MSDWVSEIELKEISSAEVRYSKGVLSSYLLEFLSPLSVFWKTFFVSLDAEVSDVFLSQSLTNQEQSRIDFLAKSEAGSLGIAVEHSSANFLAEVLRLKHEHADFLLTEYLSRRFVYSLSKAAVVGKEGESAWSFERSESCEAFLQVDVSLKLDSRTLRFQIFLDEELTRLLDAAVRKQGVVSKIADQNLLYSDELSRMRIELAELLVEPAKLIDCVRIGNQIELGELSFSKLQVTLAGKPWLSGELLLHEDRFALKTSSSSFSEKNADTTKTAVQFCFREMELDQRSVVEQEQLGAVLLCPQKRDDILEIRLGEESVGYASLAYSEGRFIATVCAKP